MGRQEYDPEARTVVVVARLIGRQCDTDATVVVIAKHNGELTM